MNEDLQYISSQITKAERQGYFDKINYPNAEFCIDLLKEIRKHCDQRLSAEQQDADISKEFPWPEPI